MFQYIKPRQNSRGEGGGGGKYRSEKPVFHSNEYEVRHGRFGQSSGTETNVPKR